MGDAVTGLIATLIVIFSIFFVYTRFKKISMLEALDNMYDFFFQDRYEK